MGGSGVIYAGIVAAWGAYFVTWLRRQEPVDSNRSVDRFSSAMRVLSRREPAVLSRQGPAVRDAAETTKGDGAVAGTPVHPATARRPTDRDSRQRVYRRRQQVLLLLAVALLGVVGTAAGGGVPWWAVAVPTALLSAYLLLLRRVSGTTARVAHRSRAVRPPATPQPATTRSADRVLHLGSFRTVTRAVAKALVKNLLAPTARPAHMPSAGAGTLDASSATRQPPRPESATVPAVTTDADTPMPVADLPAVALPYDAVTEVTQSGTAHPPMDPVSGWEPVPVPLPTYVTAPRARRVIRTIDLATPGAWTSGRLDAPPRNEHGMEPGTERDDLPAFVGDPTSPGTGAVHRRAVGD